jgi:hypothetical protein
MASFKKNNGMSGQNWVAHTATGYECYAIVTHPDDADKEIKFYARHVVGPDGNPYTEVGFKSLEPFQGRDLMNKVKVALANYGFKEVLSIATIPDGELAYSEHSNPKRYTIELRLRAGKNGIEVAFDSLAQFISKDCLNFVHEQESVEDVLYKSIMDNLGDDLRKSKGGAAHAEKRARELADYFRNGITV